MKWILLFWNTKIFSMAFRRFAIVFHFYIVHLYMCLYIGGWYCVLFCCWYCTCIPSTFSIRVRCQCVREWGTNFFLFVNCTHFFPWIIFSVFFSNSCMYWCMYLGDERAKMHNPCLVLLCLACSTWKIFKKFLRFVMIALNLHVNSFPLIILTQINLFFDKKYLKFIKTVLFV